MVEPGTGLAAVAAAWGSKDILLRVLGPTADYIGGEAKDFAVKRAENVRRIFEAAERKLSAAMLGKGQVSPSVLRGVLAEGSFCDDQCATEYYGGVLASSKSENSRDNRGVTMNAMIARLSNYQLRAHCLFYYGVKRVFDGWNGDPGMVAHLETCTVFIDEESFKQGMAFTPEEIEGVDGIVSGIMHGLGGENLIGGRLGTAITPYTPAELSEVQLARPGVWYVPAPLGIELFLWAHGMGRSALKVFFSRDFRPDSPFPAPVMGAFRRYNPMVRQEEPPPNI